MINKYVIYSREIKSKNDNNIHLVTASQVAKLHNLKRNQWILGQRNRRGMNSENYKGVLFPREDGNYKDLGNE